MSLELNQGQKEMLQGYCIDPATISSNFGGHENLFTDGMFLVVLNYADEQPLSQILRDLGLSHSETIAEFEDEDGKYSCIKTFPDGYEGLT